MGERAITCQRNNQWSGNKPSCVCECPPRPAGSDTGRGGGSQAQDSLTEGTAAPHAPPLPRLSLTRSPASPVPVSAPARLPERPWSQHRSQQAPRAGRGSGWIPLTPARLLLSPLLWPMGDGTSQPLKPGAFCNEIERWEKVWVKLCGIRTKLPLEINPAGVPSVREKYTDTGPPPNMYTL